MNKNIYGILATLLLVFFASCEKEDNNDSNQVNLDNTTWNVTSTLTTGSSYTFDVLFKDNDSFYVNSVPVALGAWAMSGDSVTFGLDTMGVRVTYKGGFPTDTTMQGRMTYGALPLGTFTGVEK